MIHFETPEEKEIVNREEKITHGEIAPADRLQKQLNLATKIYALHALNGDVSEVDTHDVDHRNIIMQFWIDEGYSKAFSRMEESDWLKYHPRLNGDVLSVEVADLEEFIQLEKEGRL